ncbi:MAG TPA: glycosyl hydrolase [Streptosporangiaceae bacterium]|nr:glycosyl hydrolase [Streptosporangiaceae bacterium]
MTGFLRRRGRRGRTARRGRGIRAWPVAAAGAAVAAAGVTLAVVLPGPAGHAPPRPAGDRFALPATPASYLGWYPAGVPRSYAGVSAVSAATGVKPALVPYYSGWFEPFQASFAAAAARDGAVPIVQMNPDGIRVAAIASGRYDGYLRGYAGDVRAYHRPVIVSFGHEMNGDWYSWGYKRTSPAAFIAAWRHIVGLFRVLGAQNVTWLWTVNIIDDPHYGKIPSPARWWPGGKYVTWVGIDGYYYHSSTAFSSLFGPTIAAVRQITGAPILIAETAAVPAAGKPAKIADLFAGVRLYGLLGFVWFDVTHPENWRLSSPEALAAFRRGARDYRRPAPGAS